MTNSGNSCSEVCFLAEQIFEDAEAAAAWLSRPNEALGNQRPIDCCITEAGCQQLRRVLYAIAFGSPV